MRYPQGVFKEELWELLWPNLPGARTDAALRLTVTRIRKALCGVDFNGGWYRLDGERVRYDVGEFESALA